MALETLMDRLMAGRWADAVQEFGLFKE
jgi:hypothetical protein